MSDTNKVWARFVLSDGSGQVYECRNRVAVCRIEIRGSEVVRFYEGGPIPRDECVAAVNELRAAEHERFLQWAKTRDYVNVSDYPAPKSLV
jgi:hypothetical protein